MIHRAKFAMEYIRNGGNIRAAFKKAFPAHQRSTDRVIYAMCKGYTSHPDWQPVEAEMLRQRHIRTTLANLLRGAEQIKSDHPELYAAIKHELDTYLD